MQQFDYQRPSSLTQALEILRAGGDKKALAGGQSLLPAMKLDLAAPDALVSLRDVPEMRGISVEDGHVRIGAMTTHDDVANAPEVRERIPALADMAEGIGDPQVRNRGTIGGSLAHADPAADYPAAIVGLDATVETDRRRIPGEDFFTGLFSTALEPDELIVAVHFPVPEAAAYAKFGSPASKYAITGVMVARSPSGVRVAVTGAGTSVFRQTAMEEALSRDFSESALEGIRQDSASLNSDLEASAEYRAHLVGVMARRAVRACL